MAAISFFSAAFSKIYYRLQYLRDMFEMFNDIDVQNFSMTMGYCIFNVSSRNCYFEDFGSHVMIPADDF